MDENYPSKGSRLTDSDDMTLGSSGSMRRSSGSSTPPENAPAFHSMRRSTAGPKGYHHDEKTPQEASKNKIPIEDEVHPEHREMLKAAGKEEKHTKSKNVDFSKHYGEIPNVGGDNEEALEQSEKEINSMIAKQTQSGDEHQAVGTKSEIAVGSDDEAAEKIEAVAHQEGGKCHPGFDGGCENGQCIQGRCVCDQGWGGPSCDEVHDIAQAPGSEPKGKAGSLNQNVSNVMGSLDKAMHELEEVEGKGEPSLFY